MKIVRAILAIGLWGMPLTLQAAEDSPGRGVSVYRINPIVDGSILLAASAGSVVPLILESKIIRGHCPCDRNDVNRFDRPVIDNDSKAAGWISHFVVSFAIATPLVLDYQDQGWGRVFMEDFIVYAQVLSIDTSINNLARYTVQRPRPHAYRETPPPDDTGSYLSFNAGHVASTVAALSAASMTYGYRYGHRAWPWVVTGTVGLTEAYLRSAAGKHFYTDDILGLFVGTSVGIVVPMLHHRGTPLPVTLVPVNRGAQLVWRRNF